MRAEFKMMAEGLVEVVRGYVRQAQDALGGRIDALEKRLTELPAPKDGEAGKEGPAGKDAPPVDENAIAQRVLAAIPVPADGKDGAPGSSVTVDDVRPLVVEEVAKAVAAIPAPAAGRDGRDGMAGRDGEKGLDGKDGANGVDGQDGLGFDDLTVEHDGDRGFTFKFQQGDRVKSFPFTLPIVLDRGYYREGEAFEKGDGVTFGGSYWIAQGTTRSKPEIGNAEWRLAVKKGRDAKASVELPK